MVTQERNTRSAVERIIILNTPPSTVLRYINITIKKNIKNYQNLRYSFFNFFLNYVFLNLNLFYFIFIYYFLITYLATWSQKGTAMKQKNQNVRRLR